MVATRDEIRAMSVAEQAELIGGGVQEADLLVTATESWPHRRVVSLDRLRALLTVPTRMVSAMTVSGDWCPATLADKGRIPCAATTIHNPHHGCRFELIDADVNRDHEEDTR